MHPAPKKKFKHNYTSELELKSLLIRIKNQRGGIGSDKDNTKINKYVTWFVRVNNKKYDSPAKRNITKAKLKAKIIELSEKTSTDKVSYERFGEIILLMVKNILKKPQFSGYTYKDDFYSDAVYKILKYLGNFNHLLISERTGLLVNAFAYISQIIHNSILFILNTKKKEIENHKKQVERIIQQQNISITFNNWYDEVIPPPESVPLNEYIEISEITGTLHDEIINLSSLIDKSGQLEIIYPADYMISFDEYNSLKPLLKGKVSIIRAKVPAPKSEEETNAE